MKSKVKQLVKKIFHGKATAQQIRFHVKHGGKPVYLVIEKRPDTSVFVRKGCELVQPGTYSQAEWNKIRSTLDESICLIIVKRVNRLTPTVDEEDE